MADSILFIPDISGFSKFVKTTEINHSKHIIEELINIIIDEGRSVFEVAEVEGDAVFFYTNESYSAEKVIGYAKRIYTAFHKHLLSYEHGRICQCGACNTAIDLKLKFIVHRGEISLAKFGSGKAKPFGDAVIEAHKLLKNDVSFDQYVLFTKSFLGDSNLALDGEGAKLDELGTIEYNYLLIDHWKSDVIIDKKEAKKKEVDLELKVTRSVPVDSSLLHFFISDFRFRSIWNIGASEIIYDQDAINQSGSEHYCVVDGKDLYFDTIKPDYVEGLSYGEVLKNPAPLKYLENNFLLASDSFNKTRLTIVMRISFRWWIHKLMKPMIAKKMKQQANQILASIHDNALKHKAELLQEIAVEADLGEVVA